MFIWKLSTKFVLSALNGASMIAVLLLGGLLVIDGRIQGPTAFLIAFYRQVSATRVKFELSRDVAGSGWRETRAAGSSRSDDRV